MVNLMKLKALFVENGFTNEMVARNLHMSNQSFSKKMNNEREFKFSEICKICSLFNLSKDDIVTIFFNNLVDFKSTSQTTQKE